MKHKSCPAVGRRRLLQGLAGAGVALPFLRNASTAHAAGKPKRLITFFTPNSMIHPDVWTPGDGFSLPEMFSELAPYRSRMLFVDGINFGAGSDDRKGGHNCTPIMLTGMPNHYPGSATHVFTSEGASIDQVIAKSLGSECLVLGSRISHSTGTYRISYSAPRSPVTPITDPYTAFSRTFPTVPSDTGSADAADARRRLVLGATKDQLNALTSRIARADRYKLEQHMDEVSALEQRLARKPTGMCSPTMLPAGTDFSSESNFGASIRAQMDIAVQALRCELTRVVTLQIGSSGAAGTPRLWGLDVSTGEGEHTVAHAYRKGRDDVAITLPDRMKVEQFYMRQLRYLLDSLGPDLDDTLVLCVKSIGVNHSETNIPFMLIGGETDGSYRTGRHLRAGGRNNNDLLSAVGNVMGVPMTSFGAEKYNAGPLSLA